MRDIEPSNVSTIVKPANYELLARFKFPFFLIRELAALKSIFVLFVFFVVTTNTYDRVADPEDWTFSLPGLSYLKTDALSSLNPKPAEGGPTMPESTYKIIELVGTSTTSWEDAAKAAVEMAGESLKEMRIAEVTRLDLTIENGKVKNYRTRINVSFKYVKE